MRNFSKKRRRMRRKILTKKKIKNRRRRKRRIKKINLKIQSPIKSLLNNKDQNSSKTCQKLKEGNSIKRAD